MAKQARRYARRSRRVARPADYATVQYTVRGVPAHIDKALRCKAQERRTSLNALLREALINEVEGVDRPDRVHHDLDALAGGWVDVPGFDEAVEAQDRVDEALWR